MPGRRTALAMGLWRGGMIGEMAGEIFVIGAGSDEELVGHMHEERKIQTTWVKIK